MAPPSPDLVPELPLLALLFFTMARFAGIQKKKALDVIYRLQEIKPPKFTS